MLCRLGGMFEMFEEGHEEFPITSPDFLHYKDTPLSPCDPYVLICARSISLSRAAHAAKRLHEILDGQRCGPQPQEGGQPDHLRRLDLGLSQHVAPRQNVT